MEFWYEKLPWYLTPLLIPAALYRTISNKRYQQHLVRAVNAPQPPVIVIGNTVIGGGGKSPMIHRVAKYLQNRGLKVAVISRGYGGNTSWPHVVTQDSDYQQVGDEAIMHFRRGLNVVCDPNRVGAYEKALSHFNPDIVLSDDGLQHYKLDRSVEIALLDAKRLFGNGHFIPAGPLRESVERWYRVDMRALTTIDAKSDQGSADRLKAYLSELRPSSLVRLSDNSEVDISQWVNREVHVVAAIANPKRVAATVESLGLRVLGVQPFRDHRVIPPSTFSDANRDFIITEKDAARFKEPSKMSNNIYVLKVDAHLSEGFFDELMNKISEKASEKD